MRYTIVNGGEPVEIDISLLGPGRYRVKVGDGPTRTVDASVYPGLVHLHLEGRSYAVTTGHAGDETHVGAHGHQSRLELLDPRVARLRARKGGAAGGAAADLVRSPMPGRIIKVMVAPGDTVVAGQGVVIVEAMKMENELRVERGGVVEAVDVKEGDLVEANAPLVHLRKQESTDD